MLNSSYLGKTLVLLGSVIVITGVFLWVGGKDFPLLNRLGKLPGDIRIQKEGFSFYFPITTCVLISGAVTLISMMFRWLSKN